MFIYVCAIFSQFIQYNSLYSNKIVQCSIPTRINIPSFNCTHDPNFRCKEHSKLMNDLVVKVQTFCVYSLESKTFRQADGR